MKTLTELADLYIVRCEVEGKSPRTVQAYRYTLGRFTDALTEDEAPARAAEITREHIYAYLSRFKDHAADTRHRYFREVRCFFNWLVDTGYLDTSPFRGVKNIRLPQRIVQPFSAAEVATLLASCEDGPLGIRDRALLLALLDTGARCSEVVQLDLTDLDLDLDTGRLRIRFGRATSSGSSRSPAPTAGRSSHTWRCVARSRDHCSWPRTGTVRWSPG